MMMMTDQAPENTGRTESAAPESRRRSVAKRFGAVLGPLFLFVGLPVALRTLLERVPWSGFEQILAADAERTGRGEPAVWPSVGKYDSANAYLTDASFLGGATNDPAMLEVLEALADPATRSPDAGEPHAESAE